MGTRDRQLENSGKSRGVGFIEIDHAPCSAGEALDRFEALTEQCLEMAASEQVRVVVCRCGAKPGSFAALDAYGKALTSSTAGSLQRPSLVDALAGLPQPLIFAMDGEVAAMELEVALTGDIRVCSAASMFAMPQILRGQTPCFGGTQRLTRLVGKGKALEMILTGNPIDAGQAFGIGLVNQVVPAHDLGPTVESLAAAMAAKGPIALQFAKEAVHAGSEMPIGKGLGLEADLYFLLHTTRDRSEGIRAFQEKRRPRFEGR